MSPGRTDAEPVAPPPLRPASGGEIILTGLSTGFLGAAAVGLAPIPLLLVFWRREFKYGLQALLLAFVCLMFLGLTLPFALIEVLGVGWVAIVLARGFRSGQHLNQAGAKALFPIAFFVMAGIFGVLAFAPGVVQEWETQVLQPAFESMSEALETNTEGDLRTSAMTEEVGAWLKANPARPLGLFPGLFILMSIVALAADLLIVSALDVHFERCVQLLRWRPPALCFWALSLGLILVLFGLHWEKGEVLLLLGIDLLLALFGIYLVSGTAITAYLLERLGMPRWVRWSLMIGVFLMFGAPFIVILGLADFWIDFRKRWPQAPEEA